MTVAEFGRLPEDWGPVYHELRRGELIAVTRLKGRHYRIQIRLQQHLARIAPQGIFVGTAFAFRPVPEHELRVADIVCLSQQRFDAIDPDDYLRGVPELVIEILSPSNTAAEIYDKEKLCLDNGGWEFWVVDPDRRQVKVSTPDGRTVTWRHGQEISSLLFENAKIALDDIFD